MIGSAVQAKINRSMDDPLILAAEIQRFLGDSAAPKFAASGAKPAASGAQGVRAIVRLYAQKTQVSPTLKLHRSTEEATIRIMDSSKFCPQGVSALAKITGKAGWVGGPVSQDAILAPPLAMGVCLVDTSNAAWAAWGVQTAAGQVRCLEGICRLFEKELASGSHVTHHNKDAVRDFARVAGLWQQISERLLPGVRLDRAATWSLEQQFVDISRRGGLCSKSCSSWRPWTRRTTFPTRRAWPTS